MKAWAKERKSFGKALMEYQAIQWMIADSETELFAGRAMTYEAAQRADAGEDALREISMAKLFCTEMVGRITDRGEQVFGGLGYTRGCRWSGSIAWRGSCASRAAARRSSA